MARLRALCGGRRSLPGSPGALYSRRRLPVRTTANEDPMPKDVICPSCGYRNPPDLEGCESCNFPLYASRDVGEPTRVESTTLAGAPVHEAPRRVLRRPQRRGAPMGGQTAWLWLFFRAIFVAAILLDGVHRIFQGNVPA